MLFPLFKPRWTLQAALNEALPHTKQHQAQRKESGIVWGRRGDLVKILWHDGIGMSLYGKCLEAGKFVWSAGPGVSPPSTCASTRWMPRSTSAHPPCAPPSICC
ncbi:IS66 family insertion sequence element accessory protein TnpB [Mesorhizobium sp. CAU 1732]|uniref:IS66 family insertion sequence element accessory protein TnpB n=1 Tax=Mesorhizobium sp. CAU 1732 TaxID=3140358 RepID=UPI0032607ED3